MNCTLKLKTIHVFSTHLCRHKIKHIYASLDFVIVFRRLHHICSMEACKHIASRKEGGELAGGFG